MSIRGEAKIRFTVVGIRNTEFIVVLLLINYCIIFDRQLLPYFCPTLYMDVSYIGHAYNCICEHTDTHVCIK